MCGFAAPVYYSATYAYRPQFSFAVNIFGQINAQKWNFYKFPAHFPMNCLYRYDSFAVAAGRMPLFIFGVAVGLSFICGLISLNKGRIGRRLGVAILVWIGLSFLLDYWLVIHWAQSAGVDGGPKRLFWYYPIFAIQSVVFVVLTAFIIPALFGRATASLANRVLGQLRRA